MKTITKINLTDIAFFLIAFSFLSGCGGGGGQDTSPTSQNQQQTNLDPIIEDTVITTQPTMTDTLVESQQQTSLDPIIEDTVITTQPTMTDTLVENQQQTSLAPIIEETPIAPQASIEPVSQEQQEMSSGLAAEDSVIEVPVFDYQPTTVKQDQEADSSNDLYVEPTFGFNTFKVLSLDIEATNDKGDFFNNKTLFIYSIDPKIEALDDQRLSQKTLLAIFKTDGNGHIYQQIEVAQSVNKLLLILNVIGIENEYIKDVSENTLIQHSFN